MDIKEIVENAMSEAESKYPPSDIENALENVLKRAENTAPGEERAAVRSTVVITPKQETGEHKIIKALAGIAAVAAVLAGAFFGLKYLSDNNIELLKEGGGNVIVTGTNEPAVTAAPVTKDEEITTSKTTALSDKITEIKKKIAEKKAGIENAETEKNAYSKKAEDANNILNALAETLVNLRALDETPEILQEIKGIEADIDYYSEIKAAYDDQISVLDDHIDRLKQELSVLEQELLEAERSRATETESTTEISAEITTNALLYDTAAEISASTFADTTLPESSAAVSSETTEPAEVSPTDDELKALVEQGAEACGLNVSISDLTRGSLKLHYTRDKSVKYADKLAYEMGNRYEIQVCNSAGEWETYDPETLESWNDGTHWFDSLLGLGGEYENEEEKETVLFYGKDMYETEIPNGNYRVKKGVNVYSEVTGEHLGRQDAYAEFTIDEHTPNIFGITMTAKNVSPESVTLAVQQSGAGFHVKRNLGYKARFVLESKTGSGEWKKVDGNPTTWAPDVEPLTENGVTEIKEDFSDIYGSLSDGTYRISKQFVNYVGNGETKDDIINSSTYYCEFVIGEKTHDWGITMSAKDVTPAGMTLVIDRKGGDAAGEIDFGEEYHLEIKNDENGMWERLRCVGNDVCFVDIATMLDPGAHIETKIDWTYLYSYLPAGHYRFVKQFTELGSQEDCDFYMEFDVPETVSKLGITLNTKRNTARWITLDAASIGDTVSEHMSFNENRYVIEQKKNGKWTEYYTTAVPGIPTPETARKINAGDVVTFTVDWLERAGSLPVGEYRIGITFTGGSVSETIYAEFTVEEYMTNEFGLQIQPIEVSRTGGKFGINSLGGEKDGRARYTNAFLLQKQASDGEWKGVKHVHEDGDTGIISYYIGLHTGAGCIGNLEEVAWSYFFGALKNGHYRLGKTFREDVDGEAEQIEVYCEFDITDDTPEKLE